MLETWKALLLLGLQFAFPAAVAVYLLLRRKWQPSTTLAWLIVIVALPIVGILAYLMVGEVRLGRRRIRRHAEIVRRSRAHVARRWTADSRAEVSERYRSIAILAETAGGMGPRAGNLLELFSKTDSVIDALIRDIDGAKLHCHLLFYIYLADGTGTRLGEALGRAAQRGVDCRLLVDAVGSRPFLASALRRSLESCGVIVVGALPANPLRVAFARMDLRNHRKIAVVDGHVGFTGSQNVADAAFAIKPRFAPWVDTMLRIEGPAVRDLQGLFIEDWYLDTKEPLDELLEIAPPVAPDGVAVQIIGSGPNSHNEALRQVNHASFHLAREELTLTTPYFVPDDALTQAMCTAALCGVQTRLVVPKRNDSPLVAAASRAYYEPLLAAGVEIHEYTKGLLHAKTMTVDRELAHVSTANLDRRSFELNFEVSTLVYDSDFASQLRFVQNAYIADSLPVDAARWKRRPWPKRLAQNAAGLLSPVL